MDANYCYVAVRYYLVDSGYKLDKGYLVPYCDKRYHKRDFEGIGDAQMGNHDIFNYAHSSLRVAVEHSFGVLKKRWTILKDVPYYDDVDMQK